MSSQSLVERANEIASRQKKKNRSPVTLEKGPRVYAREILALPLEQRAAALKQVPPHLFGIINDYVNDPYAEARAVNAIAARIAQLATRADRIAELAKVQESRREAVKAATIKIMEARKNGG